MHSERPHPHPLLAQIPLTVSPFITLPSAPTLPYTYKPLPSTLPPPPSVLSPPERSDGSTAATTNPSRGAGGTAAAAATADPSSRAETKTRFIISASGGVAAHPDEIIESCRALQAHLMTLQEDAARMVRDWEAEVARRELAEKRSVAPGWLDREEKLLEPERRRMGARGGDGDGEMEGGEGKEGEGEKGKRKRKGEGSVGVGAGGLQGDGDEDDEDDENDEGNGKRKQQQRQSVADQGEELDRAFGGLGFR
ncbi:MAG: hypothetical protein M1816_003456 [Peltula sp. TS41687]|nr:MAG: hypothetical protein M1816_003456 [Peltula sp. TS41687]